MNDIMKGQETIVFDASGHVEDAELPDLDAVERLKTFPPVPLDEWRQHLFTHSVDVQVLVTVHHRHRIEVEQGFDVQIILVAVYQDDIALGIESVKRPQHAFEVPDAVVEHLHPDGFIIGCKLME
eukprot:CAMPEP_0170513048 /NCGR_PEP_ID=MMETSP0208-20121228/67182_1 /TAXON_ID=197538 /ORGANISM="Strombidium inclinatum, Strain S3" /LENGTH=124 /DNA_ID=CAMNT_0010796737 /DNA_START=1590 /DNA_END=1964 /DNA_ORIENTATION=+